MSRTTETKTKTEQVIERVLRTREEVEPSSGFVASVMTRVHREAAASAAPPPLSFPWRRVVAAGLAGLATAIVLVLVLGGVLPDPLEALEGVGRSGELPALLTRLAAVLLVTWLATAVPRWLVS